jgi:hypothetical protein
MLKRLSLFVALLSSDLHRLIQLILDDFSGRRFNIFEGNRWLFRSALGLKSVALRSYVVLCSSRESLTHVSVSLVLFVYQVICGSDMVVSIGLEASDRVLLLKLEVVDESRQQIASVGHLL